MARVSQPGSRRSVRPSVRTKDRLPLRLSLEFARLEGRLRTLSVFSGLAAAVVVFAMIALVVMALDYWIDLSTTSRWLAFLMLLGSTCSIGVYALRRMFRDIPLPELAAAVEEMHPDFGERLLSLVEFIEPGTEEKDKGSAMMRSLLERETLELVTPTDFAGVIDHSRTGWRVAAACIALALLLVPFTFGGSSYRLLWARLLTPWSNYERPSNLFFEVQDGDQVVARGEDAKVVATAGWRNRKPEPIQEVRLTWAFHGAAAEARRMIWDEAAGAYSTTLTAIQQGFRFSVSSGRARTREYEVRVEDRPAITSLQIDVQPPPYTGLPAGRFTAAALDIQAFEHSQVNLQLELNKPVQHLDLVWIDLESANDTAAAKAAKIEEDSPEALTLKTAETELVVPEHLRGKFPGWIIREIEPLPLATNKKSAQFAFSAKRPGRFILHAVDEFGLDNPKEPIRSLDVRIDQPPTVEFADSNEQGTARPDEVISVPVYATDDVGLAELDLQIKNFPEGKVLKNVSVEVSKLGTQEIGEAFQVNLVEFGLLPNEVITLRARAADERQIPGPNETWTSERMVRIQQDSLPYGFEEIAKEREEWKNQLEQLRNEVITTRTELQELQKAADKAATENKPFDQDAKAPPLADTQREIAEKGEKLAATFASHPLFEKLTAPLKQVVTDEILPAADQTALVPTTNELPAKAEVLKQAVSRLNTAENALHSLQTRFEQQSMLERDLFELQRLANRTEKLAEDAEMVEKRQEATETPAEERSPDSPKPFSDGEQKQQQDMLLSQHEKLTQDLDQLIYKRPELLSAAQGELIGRLQNLLDQAGELAGQEDQLSAALAHEAQRTDAGNPTAPSDASSTPAPAEGTSPAATGPAAKTPSPEGTPPTDTSAEPTDPQLAESVTKAVAEQQRIALAARELALNSEALTGKESASTKAAQAFADQAQAAFQNLTTGSSDSAAESGQTAVQSGDQTADLFRKQPKSLGGPNEELAASSSKLAARQAELAAKVSKLSKSTAGRREVQQQAQQQLQTNTERLTKELAQVAESFGMQPLQQDGKAQEAQASGTSAQRAQDAMLATNQSLRENNAKLAAEKAKDAAMALREAGNLPVIKDSQEPGTTAPDPAQPPAPDETKQPDGAKSESDKPQTGSQEPGQSNGSQAEPPPPSPGGNSSIPPEGALNVAQAAQQLNKIGKKLAKDNAHGTPGQKPGEGKPKGDPQASPDGERTKSDAPPNGESTQSDKPGENADGSQEANPKDGQAQNSSGQQGKNGSEQSASDQLKQTAANMRKAMSQFGLPNGDPGKPSSGGKSESQQDSQATNQSDFGNTDEARIVELENHLKGLASRNWGELSGSLKTEILQSTRKKPDGDYTQLIRRYFDEISRTQAPAPPAAKPPSDSGTAP
ncbi:MAG: hypothetical protein U0929_11225 [Planctomycetaceae bacterium]